jgi:hypothetical protein
MKICLLLLGINMHLFANNANYKDLQLIIVKNEGTILPDVNLVQVNMPAKYTKNYQTQKRSPS